MTDLRPLALGIDGLEDIARELRLDGDYAEFETWLDTVSAKLGREVQRAMSGDRGAYRRVKDCLRGHDALQLWFDYEAAADLELAKGWLARQGFEVSIRPR